MVSTFPALIDNLDDNIIEIDRNCVIQKANASFLNHLKAAGSNAESPGKHFFDILPMASDLKHYFDDVFKTGNMIQFERKSPNPAINKLFMISLIPMKDTLKDVIGILFMSHEIR
jgi:hypothetical protein